MRKHTTFEHNGLSERLCEEFNNARSLRELAYIAHLFIEYYVNELTVAVLREPKLVVDDVDLGSFRNKVLLLRAMGIFENREALLRNVELIQGIRNFYAHNLLMADDAPDRVV